MKIVKRMAVWIVISLLLCFVPATALAASDTSLAVDSLTAPGGESVIRIVVDNNDTIAHNYKFSVESQPNGFNTYFMADGKVTGGLELPSESNQIVELYIESPFQPAQDNYRFTAICTRDDGHVFATPISVSINSDYTLDIATQINHLESLSGKSVSFDVVVSNTGNKTLEGVTLTAELPYKWAVESVVPEKISLTTGENSVFKISVLIPPTQAAGNNEIKISAGNADIQSQTVSIPVMVNANANYALIIIGCVLVVGLATILYFRKHGRR